MSRYEFEIAGIPAYHTITALGCPFTCHFCESGIERVRMFSETMIEADLLEILDNPIAAIVPVIEDTIATDTPIVILFIKQLANCL